MRGFFGSSPLARGTPALSHRALWRARLIPARAGNTRIENVLIWDTAAHPRSRGEHIKEVSPSGKQGGSSPLARGTPRFGCMRGLSGRLIPARAGNTWFSGDGTTRAPAHPRSRGEHTHKELELDPANGSSPLARGTLPRGHHNSAGLRLIPARAGNTVDVAAGVQAHAAHPRSRGEHRRCSCRRPGSCGSSPLARGTRIEQLNHVISSRLIPARAGNTVGKFTRSGLRTAHPRSRGEHGKVRVCCPVSSGSSPLARGTPSRS